MADHEQLKDPGVLEELGTAILVAHGVPEHDARLVSHSLVLADLWGHQSHGIMRLSWYSRRLKSGVTKSMTNITPVMDGGALCILDGNDGIGQVIANRAMRDALSRAKVHGVGVVAVRNSNHFGTAQYFTRMAAAEGCVALMTTNSSPSMAPWGGRKMAVGNNPWSISAPAGRHSPMVLDISNTIVARGKIHVAKQRNEPLPAGWALNSAGEPTIDPIEALSGLILPMAEHKGYAISTMIDVLSGVLTGSSFSTGVTGPHGAKERSGCGHLVIALDIQRFMPLDEFGARMEQLVATLKGTPVAPGYDEVFYPGEIEVVNEGKNRQDGLMLPQTTLSELMSLASDVGINDLPVRPRQLN